MTSCAGFCPKTLCPLCPLCLRKNSPRSLLFHHPNFALPDGLFQPGHTFLIFIIRDDLPEWWMASDAAQFFAAGAMHLSAVTHPVCRPPPIKFFRCLRLRGLSPATAHLIRFLRTLRIVTILPPGQPTLLHACRRARGDCSRCRTKCRGCQ